MKLELICYCLLFVGLGDASFIIQKMDQEPGRKSIKSRASSAISGRSLISSVSTTASTRKSRKSKHGNKSNAFASSVNFISSRNDLSDTGDWDDDEKSFSSVGSKVSRRSKKNNRKSYRRGRPTSMAPSSSSFAGIGRMSSSKKQPQSYSKKSDKSKKSSKSKYLPSQSQSQSQAKYQSQSQAQTQSSKESRKSLKKLLKMGQNVTIDDFVYVTLPSNQWTEFFFSEVGQLPYSRWTFDIPKGQKCTLQVVDAYCTGDRFEAVRRLDSGAEVSLFSTPPVPFNPVIAEQIRQGANLNCTPFTTDAETAWSSSSWSKGEKSLKSGNYKLILKSLLAPYGPGGAYVRLSCSDCSSGTTTTTTTTTTSPSSTYISNSQNICSFGSSGIKYIRQTLPYTQQANVCYTYGLRPLDVTTDNIRDARAVLLNCAGVGTRAWVASYNGDNYRGVVGLSLHASQFSDVGAITATPDESPLEGVLCQ